MIFEKNNSVAPLLGLAKYIYMNILYTARKYSGRNGIIEQYVFSLLTQE